MEAPHNADCPKFLNNVTRLIDGTMSNEEEQAFLASINENCECLEKLEIEQHFKQFLASKMERKCCSEKLLHSIKEQCVDDAD
ncbi:MAG: hypothetical protein KTR13_06290 [Saprospiraceae bacterium]|nr:hypothetical protein [Saprospiraceae bacterium]